MLLTFNCCQVGPQVFLKFGALGLENTTMGWTGIVSMMPFSHYWTKRSQAVLCCPGYTYNLVAGTILERILWKDYLNQPSTVQVSHGSVCVCVCGLGGEGTLGHNSGFTISMRAGGERVGRGGTLTICLLKLATPSSNAVSLVSSALPSFWRTCQKDKTSLGEYMSTTGLLQDLGEHSQ